MSFHHVGGSSEGKVWEGVDQGNDGEVGQEVILGFGYIVFYFCISCDN